MRGSAGPHGQGIRLHQHALDLTVKPTELLAVFRSLAAHMARSPRTDSSHERRRN
ncbi:hypothetical protein OG618_27580 [Kitasatospora sp. NBC_01246]|uniref:hypothetical protein n=1 Tax=Kitasatospora sp. NBC_01246 TaxID=2903570 RepID=UPI002E377CDC|nr:hypothetical protein [Kitasatospora sp. NBC_01246]